MGSVLYVGDLLSSRPSWDSLFETAAAQSGYVTTKQAAAADYSTQLLRKHILAGRVSRPQRGIYRLVHFPIGEREELVTVWLWSEQFGVFSHQTALSLHGLSDVLPSQVHLTLPESWRSRRLRIPPDVALHFRDVPDEERSWFGPVPATSVRRTLCDAAEGGISPDLLRQATQQALQRGLVTRHEIRGVTNALRPFGDLPRQRILGKQHKAR